MALFLKRFYSSKKGVAEFGDDFECETFGFTFKIIPPLTNATRSTDDEISRQMWQQVNQQRVRHIVTTYQLAGADSTEFNRALENWMAVYVAPLIELALVETLVDGWLTVPMPRGLSFLHRVQERLSHWESQPIVSTLTPEQFHQITGLDPAPVFSSNGISLEQIKV